MKDRPVLVTGASGYVGGRLVPLLLASGWRVRAVARRPEELRRQPWSRHPGAEIAGMDALDAESVAAAVRECGAVFYLIHSMIASRGGFAEADRRAAENTAAAAAAAGVERIVYLGGLGEVDHPGLSKHLRSRHEVEDIFRRGAVPVTCLRAAMILGSGSASFEMLRYLVERLPVMITPRWVSTPCQPIAIADVLGYLAGCLEVPETAGRTFDIGGPEVVSYRDLIRIYAEEAGLGPRWILPVPVLTPRLSSLWVHLVTPVPAAIARPLAEGLSVPVVCREHHIRALVPLRLKGCRETLRAALDRLHQVRSDACELPDGETIPPEWTHCGDPGYSGGTTLSAAYRVEVSAPLEAVWASVEAVGGRDGYYHAPFVWWLRGWIDRMAGGPGLGIRRLDPVRLAEGHYFHFWRVASLERPRRLLLQSRIKAPGDAFMGFRLSPAPDGTAVVLESVFLPRGLAGLAYWYGFYPAHDWVFKGLLRGLARHCGGRAVRGPERIPGPSRV